MSGRGGAGGEGEGNLRQTAPSVEPTAGLDPMTPRT